MHDDEHFYIAQEIVKSGDLFRYLEHRTNYKKGDGHQAIKRLSETEVIVFAKQLFTALHYMHEEGIVHRDIKMENILVDCNLGSKDNKLIVKLTDFGFSAFKQEDGKFKQGVGSRYYIAPEILVKKPYDQKVDVWSASIVVYILLTGEMPYPGKDIKEVANMIKKKDLKKDLSERQLSKKA